MKIYARYGIALMLCWLAQLPLFAQNQTNNPQDTTIIMQTLRANLDYTGVRFGLRIMPAATYLNNPTFSAENVSQTQELRLGFSAGLSVASQFRKNFGYETGFLFSSWGGEQSVEFTVAGADTSFSARRQAQYFQVPMLFTFHSNPNRKLQFLGMVGFHLGLLNQVQESLNDEQLPDTVTATLGRRDLYNTVDISLAVGAGVRYLITDHIALDITLRSHYSLLDVDDPIYKQSTADPSRHLVLGTMLGLSYRFNYNRMSLGGSLE